MSGELGPEGLGGGIVDEPARARKDLFDLGGKGTVDPHESLVGIGSDLWWRSDPSVLEIRGGGAVAVDTATLAAVSARFGFLGDELTRICEHLGALRNTLLMSPVPAPDAQDSTAALSRRLLEVRAETEALSAALRETAAAYELVELDVQHRVALHSGDARTADALDARMDALRAAHPDAWGRALEAQTERVLMWPSELVKQGTQLGVEVGSELSEPGAVIGGVAVGGLALGGAAFAGLAGTGLIARDARLRGGAGPVTLTPVAPVPAAGAPQTLGDVTERMPGAGDARVRVERYTMPDGTRQFAVYVAGTQQLGLGDDDPWDNTSNLQLYAGQTSDSYAATVEALRQAGAEPGDVVHAFGHSQGAMIGAHLALEGGYDTQTLVSFGSPVAADVGDGTLSVTLRHTDDPVAGLSGGGHMTAVGAPGSFVVERVADPEPGLGDVAVPAHRMVAYAETAGMVDASADPRVAGLHDALAQLARAESMEVAEYAATRGVSPSASDGG